MSKKPVAAETAPRNRGYLDLRELLQRFEEMGEVEHVDGADWNLEVGAVSETVAAANPGHAPALLFDNIPGYPKGFRILAGGANALRHVAGGEAPCIESHVRAPFREWSDAMIGRERHDIVLRSDEAVELGQQRPDGGIETDQYVLHLVAVGTEIVTRPVER